MFGHTYNNVYLCSVKTLNRKMKRYRYIKSNAFTTGASLGNPASCVFMGEETLSPEQMQAVAREHKGFVMAVLFGILHVRNFPGAFFAAMVYGLVFIWSRNIWYGIALHACHNLTA